MCLQAMYVHIQTQSEQLQHNGVAQSHSIQTSVKVKSLLADMQNTAICCQANQHWGTNIPLRYLRVMTLLASHIQQNFRSYICCKQAMEPLNSNTAVQLTRKQQQLDTQTTKPGTLGDQSSNHLSVLLLSASLSISPARYTHIHTSPISKNKKQGNKGTGKKL